MERHVVLQKACDYLARREHSRKELERKLAQGGANSDLIDELLDKLAEEGLQSDERFCESFVHHRYLKGHGPQKIRHELSQKGIKNWLVDEYLSNPKLDWYSLCAEIRQKKYGISPPKDIKDKAKQSRFLYSRGFDSEMIMYALETLQE